MNESETRAELIDPALRARTDELAARLEKYRASYYAGQPAISDAAYDGLGIPACIATAKAAATQVTAYLAARPGPAAG